MMNPNVSPKKEDEMLHPKLQAALTSLNMDLEEELNRFQQSQKQNHLANISKVQPESSSSAGTSGDLGEAAIARNNVEQHSKEEVPQDYLQSSEELLQELNNSENYNVGSTVEKPPEKNKSSWRNYLLTPLGIAGIVIFILSGTLLSLILINLGEITSRQASTPTETTEDESLPPPPEEEDATSETPEEASSPEIPNRPNLANDEFIELDADNLVEAEPGEAEPSTPSCDGNFYCVMVENPTESEYNQTLQITGDGYLREFPEVGEVLQVGAFDTEARAEELVQTLEQQGISATIYKP
ncbi:MAG: SPOR domain-containing protein [Chroococcales cyanobacterium]